MDLTTIGYWPDLDGPELRAALAMNKHQFQLQSLVSIDVPDQYRNRSVPLRSADEALNDWFERAALNMRGYAPDDTDSKVACLQQLGVMYVSAVHSDYL